MFTMESTLIDMESRFYTELARRFDFWLREQTLEFSFLANRDAL